MANVLRRIGKPGDPISVLGFDETGTTIEIQKGMIALGDYLLHPMSGAAFEQNIAKPHILKENGNYAGLIYPVIMDKGEGAGFRDIDYECHGLKYVDKEIFDPADPKKVVMIERTIEYPGIPFRPMGKVPIVCKLPLVGRFFTSHLPPDKPVFIRSMRFNVSECIRQITVNPHIIGQTCDSEIVKDTISLKPKRWQIILTIVIMFLIGFLY